MNVVRLHHGEISATGTRLQFEASKSRAERLINSLSPASCSILPFSNHITFEIYSDLTPHTLPCPDIIYERARSHMSGSNDLERSEISEFSLLLWADIIYLRHHAHLTHVCLTSRLMFLKNFRRQTFGKGSKYQKPNATNFQEEEERSRSFILHTQRHSSYSTFDWAYYPGVPTVYPNRSGGSFGHWTFWGMITW